MIYFLFGKKNEIFNVQFGKNVIFCIWAGDRLWQDAQTRVRLIKELDRITGYVSDFSFLFKLLSG